MRHMPYRRLAPLVLVVIVACSDAEPSSTREPDASALPDASVIDLDGAVETALGTFVGRQGHFGAGTVRRVQIGGASHLVFEADFASSEVPAPAVVLTDRAELGVRIDEAMGDVRVGTLVAPTGAQSYAIPSGGETLRYVHVYCEPFSVEVARADFGATP